MVKLTDKNFLYCYNDDLSKFLSGKGVSYITKARSIKDNKIFTMYQKNKELFQLINEYKLLSK